MTSVCAMEYWSILLSIVIGVISIHYLFKNFNFFKRNGIIHVPPIPLFGSAMPVLFRRMSFVDFILKIYNFNPNAKYYGLYFTTNPVFLLRDLELIKTVLVKNFEAFPDRRGFADINDTLFKKNLFSLRGEKWRNVRNLLSPSFTSSKMKIMFTLMSECAVDFVKFLSTSQADKGAVNMKDICSKYTNDVIATCAFGIKINSMKDPTNKFYIYGKEASNFRGIVRSLKFFFIVMFPRLGRILNIKFMDDYLSNFFKDIIKTTIMTRDAEHITRTDMLQLMMDIRGKEDRRELDIDDMTAQAFIFFLGGFETSSTAMCFAAHEIAANPEIQTKLQQEIDKVLEESNGEVSYEVINRLEYLDAVISEALRLYPPATVLERVCEKTFELPSTLPDEKPFIVKKGMLVWIPVLAIHHDEKYYDNPKKFDPERFLNNKMNNSSNYMPFGLGPRMCIANRFAMLEVKVLLFHLLARCELKPSAKTTSPIKFCKDFIIMPENGFCIHYLFKNFNFFKRNGIIHVPPIPLFGSAMPILFRRMSFVDFILKIYNFNPNAKYYGLYFTTTPIFLLRDLELIKTVLVKNFEAFPDRRGFADTNDTLFKKNLFSLRGEKWRNVRNLLSPSFTSSKMKIMFTLMSECAVDFVKFLSTSQADKGDINMKDVCSKYTNDVIATCAFGIKINSMKDPTNKFYIYGKEASNFRGIVRSLKFFFIGTFPRLGRILNLKIMNDNVSDFFKDIINTTIMTRDAEHITRPDMLQLMMDIRGKEGRRELDIDDMTAQAFIFFLGGFDTSSTAISTAMCFAAHEIAANPEIQTKLQQEIDKVLEESNGEVSYEVINRLEYLDAVISEALRLYPPATVLERVCEKTFELPSTLPDEKPFIVKKGMLVWIPVLAIHHDEKYYDNPKKFDPERFLNNKMNNSSNYMPFGLGPRMCIANRFAMLEVKVLLFHLLARCELEPSTKTTSPIKFCKDFILMPENGFWLNIQRRKDIHPVLESKGMDS
ncbi:uncharacterized protein [Mycetomoellerius zeteki]|uniref:uncharacterized protein n=1 Tax=Mycetomoellerius zeteki TaxID=64791 RepID=UPI00084E4732|nr:PREDICTED: uncharacterized protein LOC108723705 [Trachymyrmex zeteki]